MKEAEKILNKFIKGDIARDYDESSKKHHTVTLQTALEAINVALNKPNVSGRSELLIALQNIEKICDNQNPTHEEIWRIAYKAINSH